MNLVEWSKNPDYPTNFATCRTCGQDGLLKQAWDRRGYLCVDAKACLHRTVRTAVVLPTQPEIEEFMAEVDANDKRLFEALNRTDNSLQHFICEKCNISWSRPSTRGRPPKICPDCR